MYEERFFSQGSAKVKRGNYLGAVRDYSQVIQPYAVTFAAACTARGYARFLAGDLQGAFVDFDFAIWLQPHFVDAYLKRGEVRYLVGNFEGAIADFTRAIAIDESCTESYIGRAKVFLIQGAFLATVSDCFAAIHYSPCSSVAYSVRSTAYFEMGDFEQGQRDARQAEQLRQVEVGQGSVAPIRSFPTGKLRGGDQKPLDAA
jgi:tetratricopeptide (TPR) repeat protein